MALPRLSVTLNESDTYDVRTIVGDEEIKLAEFTTPDAAFDFIRATSEYMLLYDIFEDVYVLMYGNKEIARSAQAVFALMVVAEEHHPDGQGVAVSHEHPAAPVNPLQDDTEPVPFAPVDLDTYEFTCNQCGTINDAATADGDRCFTCGDSRYNPHPDIYEETPHV